MLSFLYQFIIGLITGFIIVIPVMPYMDFFINPLLFFIILFPMILIMFYISIIIHESGHLVFGLLSGYRFLSIRFSSLMIIKEDQLRVKRYTLAGTGGQCLMEPPEMNNGKIPVFLFNMGGSIMNILTLIFIPLLLIPMHWFFHMMITSFISINIASAIMNGIPIKNEQICNDGYNALYLSKDKEALHAFYKQMKVSAYNHRHIRLKDMDESLFLYNSNYLSNPLMQAVAVFHANRELDALNIKNAQLEIEYLLDHCSSMIGIYKHLLINDLIYIKIMNNEDPSSLFTKEHKKMRNAMKDMLSFIRTDYIYYSFINDIDNANKAIDRFEKISKNYPFKADIQSEYELMRYKDE